MARTQIKTPRDFPSVEELLQTSALRKAVAVLPRPVVSDLVKEVIASFKDELKSGATDITQQGVLCEIELRLAQARRQKIQRVINASGIVVHTNLGRAPLSEALFESIKKTVTGYGNVEYDIERGVRGKRGVACERYLALLAGAESATVVNNCAAALFLMLNSFANRRKVIVSRGELVQIGGGFRIPDILKRSGARLAEVGTTNITTLTDYENAIDDRSALLLKVHKSNFVQSGFSEEVPLKQLVTLGRKHGLPVLNDLGSGVFVPTGGLLGYSEPTVQQSVRAGADLTCFSGDKMLGGVQAGLIVGRAELITRIKKNPIFRTVRVDKIVFAVLEKMLTIYLNGSFRSDIKLWSLLSIPVNELKKRAAYVLEQLGDPPAISIHETKAFVGGGALPEAAIPSVGLVFSGKLKPGPLDRQLRSFDPPVIGRIEEDRFILDLKAVDRDDLDLLVKAIRKILK